MSAPPRLFDRLTGQSAHVVGGRVLMGRYMLPQHSRGFSLGDSPADSWQYLAGPERGWVLGAEGGSWWSGDFGPRPLPNPMIVDNVLKIAANVDEALRDSTALEDWLGIPPLVTDADERLRAHPFEERIRRDLPFVASVCRDPHARLRTEHVLVPVSRARGITWRTVTYLSAHSETWAARRLRGVEPARLLSPVRMPDRDLYENRVVAALVGRLWNFVLARTAELNAIDGMVARGQRLLDDAAARPGWRERERHFRMIAEVLDTRRFEGRIAQLHEELATLRGALAPLLESALRKGVRIPYDGRPELRSTNLFLNHRGYRRCRDLWNAWVALSRSDGTNGTPYAKAAAWCRAYAHFVLLLVVQALDQLGLQAETDAHGLHAGAEGLSYRHPRGSAVVLSRSLDDTLTLRLDGREVLRLVPLPHALTDSGDAEAVGQHLEDMMVGSAGRAAPRLAVVYPGEFAERAALPLRLRLAVHSVEGSRGLPALVPVSPSDIDSTSRVARLVRSALDSAGLTYYPIGVPCPAELVEPLTERLDWVEAGVNELVVVCPPLRGELKMLDSTVRDLHNPTSRARRRGTNSHDLEAVVRGLRSAADVVAGLTVCPVCGRRPTHPERIFRRRRDGLYSCECECGSVWETRRCAACTTAFAVLTTPESRERLGGDGDYVDRELGQELLAEPCWKRPRSSICPSCGHCAEQVSRPEAECARCPTITALE